MLDDELPPKQANQDIALDILNMVLIRGESPGHIEPEPMLRLHCCWPANGRALKGGQVFDSH